MSAGEPIRDSPSQHFSRFPRFSFPSSLVSLVSPFPRFPRFVYELEYFSTASFLSFPSFLVLYMKLEYFFRTFRTFSYPLTIDFIVLLAKESQYHY
jgi:hypothetical protein